MTESSCACFGWTLPSRTAPFTSSERWLCPPSQGRKARTRRSCRLALLCMESSGRCWSFPGTNVCRVNDARLTSVGSIHPSIIRIWHVCDFCRPLSYRFPIFFRDLYERITLTRVTYGCTLCHPHTVFDRFCKLLRLPCQYPIGPQFCLEFSTLPNIPVLHRTQSWHVLRT